MKRIFNLAILLMAFGAQALAQKTVYIPDEWKWNSSLYAENDPDGTHTWSKSRSVENDDIVIFWDNGYTMKPNELSKSDFYYIDLEDLMAKCQGFYDLEYQQLGFVDTLTTNLNKYKMMVLLLHTSEWSCYGSGYDFEINALWVNPAPCHPVGHSVAHEVGHSFHYMCYAEATGHNHQSSSTIGTGFHLPVGNGQTIWEQTAQWQANQSYPELMYDQSIGVFRNSHNYAFTHEWHRYQSYWFHYFLCQYYNDITTIAQVWNQRMTGAVDFNQSLMALKDLSVRDLYKLYFDYACRCATWDFDACAPYRAPYIGDFGYRCVLTDDGDYQVALASCPQSTGFNVIPLQIPAAGTEVTTHLTALAVGASLLDQDPGQYLDGDTRFVTSDNRHYINGGARASRGFRMGYVALMQDGERRYFSEDSIYGQGTKNNVTEDYSFTVPEGTSQLWLQLELDKISSKMQAWSSQGPSNGRIMLYAVNPDGTLAQSGSTANGYGHWFNASGIVCPYADGYIYSELATGNWTFYLGQYPGRCAEGSSYTVRQALRYRKNAREYAQANFTFNITVGGNAPSVSLRSIDYANPDTEGIQATLTDGLTGTSEVYDLQGHRLTEPQRGLNIIDGRKVVVE